MRSLVVIALLAACTLHVEMEVRSVATERTAAAPPWKSPQVGVSGNCNPMAARTIECHADEWNVLDVATCTMQCGPMPAIASSIRSTLGNATVMW